MGKNKISREALIEESLNVRAFVFENIIFVNLLSIIKPYSFCCELDQLDMRLKSLDSYPIVTKLTIDNNLLDATLVKHISVNRGNKCKITLNDGKEIVGESLDYEAFSPTPEEFKKIILSSIEKF